MTAATDANGNTPPPAFAPALQTIVELVRRITKADTASILGFSLKDEVVTWKAASGFTLPVDYKQPVFRPLGSAIARRAYAEGTIGIIQGIGTRTEFPEQDFPVNAAEGITDMAVVPLGIRGDQSGALTAGYRSSHQFTEEEKLLLQDLAEMASVVLESERLVKTVTTAEKIWEQTFHAIGEGILVYDSDGSIIRANSRAAEMLEIDPASLIDMSFTDVFSRMFGQRAADYYLAGNYGASAVVEIRTEYGRRFLVSISPVQQPDGKPVSVITWNDVTRLSEVQDQLGRSRRLASVGQLAAGVAHEVNNPLAAITTCAEAVMRDLARDEMTRELSEIRQWNYYLEEIVRQALRCKDITRGLLDLTRQRQAKRVLCDINSVTKQCAKVALQRAGADTQFKINLDENIGEVATDAELLRQVLDNLLANGIDALGENGGTVEVSTIRDGDRVAIEIADTGQGIPEDILAKIFDPFFSTKGPGKGYGLGLAISLSLAESLGGGITVETKEGEGSKFRLWIPRRAPE